VIGASLSEIDTLHKSVPRIVFINRYSCSDHSATSRMLAEQLLRLAGDAPLRERYDKRIAFKAWLELLGES
jgi:hypothetical protein